MMKEMRVSALNKSGKKIAFHNYFEMWYNI